MQNVLNRKLKNVTVEAPAPTQGTATGCCKIACCKVSCCKISCCK